MKKVLIFGCDGFVGKYLVEEFALNQYSVFGVGLSNISSSLSNKIDRYTIVDILEYEKVKEVINDINPDYIVNLAAISSVGLSWKTPQKTIDVNVNGALNILEAVKELGLKSKILLIGSSEEYDVSTEKLSESSKVVATNPYAISKLCQEQFACIYREKYGLNIISTRTFNHTGVGQPEQFVIPSFIKQVVDIHKTGKDGVIKVGDLSIKRDFGDVRDMACAYRKILESDVNPPIINVGSGNSYSLKELLDYIISLIPEKVEIVVDKSRIRPIDNPSIWCDNAMIKSLVGWEPRYTIFDAIDSIYRDMLNQ